jgi:hypothetical protein
MQLTVHFLVTLIKTPHHLVPEFLPMTAGFTKDISGLNEQSPSRLPQTTFTRLIHISHFTHKGFLRRAFHG